MNRRPGRIKSQPALRARTKDSQWFCQNPQGKEKKRKPPRKEQARDERKGKTHDGGPHQKQPHVNHRQQHLPPRLLVPPPIHKQPKDPTEPEREPARKQRRDKTE